MTATAIIASSIAGLVIGKDDDGVPIRLRVGDNQVDEA